MRLSLIKTVLKIWRYWLVRRLSMSNDLLNNKMELQDIIIDLLNSLSAVKDLSELDCQANDEKELIKNALRVLIQNQDMERCSFFLLDESGCLVNLAGLGINDQLARKNIKYKPLQFNVGEGVVGAAAETGQLQHCQNCLEDNQFFLSRKMDKALLPGSIISVPVFANNEELIGVLNTSHPEPYHFNDWHIRMLGIYKNMLGQLITNYRMFHQMELLISKRTEKLNQALADVQSLKEHFESISSIDQLTGLYNRRYFYDQVEIALAKAKRYGESLCLLMLDLDQFKEVNDSYGHSYGDTVLKKTSETLKKQIRDSDILVRYGGEEFVIIFTNTNCSNGNVFAERIRESVESLAWDKNAFVQTISVGLYCYSSECCAVDADVDEMAIDKLIHYADTALYKAKEQGRNQVVTFSEAMLEK